MPWSFWFLGGKDGGAVMQAVREFKTEHEIRTERRFIFTFPVGKGPVHCQSMQGQRNKQWPALLMADVAR